MKTKIINPKVIISTLGCSKNINDSEVIRGALKANGIPIVEHLKDANVLIINTCGFIEQSKQESIDVIMNSVAAKDNGQIKHIIVVGCLSERYRQVLKPQIPQVDYFFGVDAQNEIIKVLTEQPKIQDYYEKDLITPPHYAYLKISDGCNHNCAFCAIPIIKGRHVSKPMEQILKEAKTLCDNGVKELNVIAQDTTFYGWDLYKKNMLHELLARLADESGAEWIRILYTYPSGFPIDIIKLMNEKSNICKYIDIPLQHISDNILKRMKRNITSDETKKLIDDIRDICPDITLRTTFISGYPEETEREHKELLKFIEEKRFNKVGFFAYSNEEGTDAFSLKNHLISKKIVSRRIDELMSVQADISYDYMNQMVGKKCNILIDTIVGNDATGRTINDAPDIDSFVSVKLPENHKIKEGNFVRVEITQASDYDLEAQIID